MLKFKINLNLDQTYGARVGWKIVFSQIVGNSLNYIEQDPVTIHLPDPPINQPPHFTQPTVGKSPGPRKLNNKFRVRRLEIFNCFR